MYASNRYDREVVRVPKNYGGNAFSLREEEGREMVEPPATLVEEPQRAPNLPPAPPAPPDEQLVTLPSEQPKEVARDGVASGIGQEELLLLSLLLLLRGEGEAAGRSETEELRRMLTLLLLLG